MAKRKNVGSMPSSKLRTFNSFDEFSIAAQEFINSEIVNFAQDDAKFIMQEVLDKEVYSYVPNYFPVDRREDRGGLKDTGYMFAAVGYHNGEWQLEMTNYAPWHHYKFGSGTPNKSLADAIESGEGMHGAGGRPFYRKTEEKIAERLDEDITYALKFF